MCNGTSFWKRLSWLVKVKQFTCNEETYYIILDIVKLTQRSFGGWSTKQAECCLDA
jgi:hypothetical protein